MPGCESGTIEFYWISFACSQSSYLFEIDNGLDLSDNGIDLFDIHILIFEIHPTARENIVIITSITTTIITIIITIIIIIK